MRFEWPLEHNLEPAEDNVRQSDVTLWGMVAMICGALAIVLGNLSPLVPDHLMTGLHSTRLEGGNLNGLRAQVAKLVEDNKRMRGDNRRMMAMLTLADKDQTALVQRVGAVENVLPGLLAYENGDTRVDHGLITAGIADEENAVTMETEGGDVVMWQKPLYEKRAAVEPELPDGIPSLEESLPATLEQPAQTPRAERPLVLEAETVTGIGLALGERVELREALLAWKDITNRAGTLLLGLEPRISGDAMNTQMRLIAGPVPTYAQAEIICDRLLRVGVKCLPVSYAGSRLIE